MMITAENVIQIKKGYVDEMLDRFRVAKGVHTFEGFIIMEVLKNVDHPDYDELKICTTWENQSYFESWLTSRNAQKVHEKEQKKGKENPEASPILGNKLSIFEVAIQHHPAVNV